MTQLYFKFINHVNNINGVPTFCNLKSKLADYQNDKQGSNMVNGLWYDLNDYYKKTTGHDINDNGWTSNLQWLYMFGKTNSSYKIPLAYLSVFDTQEHADNYDVNNAHYSLYKILDKTKRTQPNTGQTVTLTNTADGYDIKMKENKTYYLRIDIGNPTSAVYNYPFVNYNHQPFNCYYDRNKPHFYDEINDITCTVPYSITGIKYNGKSTTDVSYNIDASGKTSVIKFNTSKGTYSSDFLHYNEFLIISPKSVTPPKQNKIIIDFLHDKETNVQINSKDDTVYRDKPLVFNPINYDFTKSKGVTVDLETDLKSDSTKYITAQDTFYTIYYFKDGKPEDLDINNYSIDYLNHHADTKYITKPEDNKVAVATNIYTPTPMHDNTPVYYDHSKEKISEAVITPAKFPDYGYYLILPLELKDYYGVLVDNNDNVLQKVYPNKVNKIEEKYRPKYKDVVIGYYNEPYDEVGGELIKYYYYHNKEYGITTQGYIDPNRYDNFICLPFDVMMNSQDMGTLPAFKLKYRTLSNLKKDLGGYYNPTTGKIDPITIKDHTISSTGGSTRGSSGSTTGGSSGSTTVGSSGATTGGSSGSTTGGTTGGSTTGGSSGSTTGGSSGSTTGGTTDGSTTGGSSESNIPNTPINLNDQIHLYSINQQNIIDLSTKDLDYQTSLKKFATYDANNFINQVYILPFSLPNNLKELDDHIVTGLYKLDTDTIAIKQDHYDLNLGSITVKPKYNNGFDYNVTKCTLHLPFTNLINLDINEILNKTISIKYKISLLNADTTVNILSDDNLIFTDKINIGTDLQLFSINSNNIAGLLNSVLQNEVLIPYITITRNKPINNLVSYETSEHNQLSNYTGFVQTNNSSVSCGTQEEQQEIENLLNGGIYIK